MEPRVSTGAILFTDMVESTALRTRLGDDRADLVREHHDDAGDQAGLAVVVADERGFAREAQLIRQIRASWNEARSVG